MPEFEVFKKRMVPLAKEPYVTIQSRGILSMNVSAYTALGEPKAVELLWDRTAQIIGLRAVDLHEEHAYPIRVSNAGKTYLMSILAFMKYYEIPFGPSRRWRAKIEDGVLMVDLTEPGTEVTSGRNGHTKLTDEPG